MVEMLETFQGVKGMEFIQISQNQSSLKANVVLAIGELVRSIKPTATAR